MKNGAVVTIRAIQQFLGSQAGNPGVYTVSIDEVHHSLLCDCPGFGGRGICKHTKYVQARMDENNGIYPMRVLQDATEADRDYAETSDSAFRNFVARFGEIIEF